MSFLRAYITAMMAAAIVRGDGYFYNVAIFVVFGLLWHFSADPMPGAIKRGLEAFAREYRR